MRVVKQKQQKRSNGKTHNNTLLLKQNVNREITIHTSVELF